MTFGISGRGIGSSHRRAASHGNEEQHDVDRPYQTRPDCVRERGHRTNDGLLRGKYQTAQCAAASATPLALKIPAIPRTSPPTVGGVILFSRKISNMTPRPATSLHGVFRDERGCRQGVARAVLSS